MAKRTNLKTRLKGLTFGECVRFFAEQQTEREKRIGSLVNTREGELETDDTPMVSEGNDNGAYVMTWSWVDFAGTEFDKQKDVDE